MKEGQIYDIVVIGGGPAGMAAAWSARQSGVERILILERENRLGGILGQCIHNGFGIGLYDQDYTGPEYAELWMEKIENEQIEVRCGVNVYDISRNADKNYVVFSMGREIGLKAYETKAVILACGCRERTLGQMRIPGSRPAGVFMAGSAQYMINMQNLKIGNSAVIMGFGDIGLIMARRMSLEGIKVKLVFGEHANGLNRNYLQCIKAFGIECRLHYTLLSTHGYQRLKGITIAPRDGHGQIDFSKKEYIPCDTLLVAAGLIPETELGKKLGLQFQADHGICTDENGMASEEGIFACGNITEIADLVDKVTMAGMKTGQACAFWLNSKKEKKIQNAYDKQSPYRPSKMNDCLLKENESVCILCPNGCKLVKKGDHMEGFLCERGKRSYDSGQCGENIKMIFTTTVKVAGEKEQMLSVRSREQITAEQMFKIMKSLRKFSAEKPVYSGQCLGEWEGIKIFSTQTLIN